MQNQLPPGGTGNASDGKSKATIDPPPLSSGANDVLAQTIVIEPPPSQNPASPHAAPSTPYGPGDLVEINRHGVNCRAWMSAVAPVRCVLSKGTRATIVGEPFRFGQHLWARLRLQNSQIHGCVATRYVDRVEHGHAATPATAESRDQSTGLHLHYRAGDLLSTASELRLRSGPGIDQPVMRLIGGNQLGTVLGESVLRDERTWVPVRFSSAEGWVAAQYTFLLNRATKWLEVELATQTLTTWSDSTRARSLVISSGKPGFATPTGTFAITQKIPVRRLRGNILGEQWDIPGVPWIMIFRDGGFYIHSAYWHDDFGQPVSHGCVTLTPDDAEWLYEWTPLGTPIWIHD